MNVKSWFLLSLLFIPLQSAFAYYCSTREGNGFINVGDSMAQVRSACGGPTQQSKPSLHQTTQMVTTQYWIYENTQVSTTNVLAIQQTRKVERELPTLVVQITAGKVINITQGGDATQSGYCASMGNTVQVGDSVDQVNANCGKPTYVNTEQHQKKIAKPQQRVTWTYQWDSYTQPLTLEFIDGQLTRIDGS